MVRVNVHIDVDSLIRHNREWLRFRADVFECSPLHVQNIIAWRQHSTIISVRVRSNPRDFFFSALAQDDERVFSIGFTRDLWRISIRKLLNLLERNDLQMSLHEAWRHSIIRCTSADQN